MKVYLASIHLAHSKKHWFLRVWLIMQDRLALLNKAIIAFSVPFGNAPSSTEQMRAECMLDFWLRYALLLSEAYGSSVDQWLDALVTDDVESSQARLPTLEGTRLLSSATPFRRIKCFHSMSILTNPAVSPQWNFNHIQHPLCTKLKVSVACPQLTGSALTHYYEYAFGLVSLLVLYHAAETELAEKW